MTKPDYLKTKIFLDSGNPEETEEACTLLGFLDGQTTNPSLVTKNPHIQELKEEKLLDVDTIWENYKEVALKIKSIIPDGSISVEVYADKKTTEEAMLKQGRELAQWFPGIFVKLPTTAIGLSVAKVLSEEGININMTLCFSQEQAAAVHMATKDTKGEVYVSPFIGRLDDIGQNGINLIENILRMYKEWGSHVQVLAASIRSTDHLFGCMQKGADIITVPLMCLQAWNEHGLANDPTVGYTMPETTLSPILYLELEQKDFTEYNVQHDLTDKGIEKFVSDWKSLLPAIDQ